MTLSDYLSFFLSLNTNKRMGQVAPHKAVLLLSVIDLIESGMITAPTFSLTEQLEKKFLQNWKRYVGTSILFKPAVATPFWHMQHEPFWELKRSDGFPLDGISTTPSISKVRQCCLTATLNKELFALMKDETSRAQMRTTLISTYLNKPKPEIKKVIPVVVGLVCSRLWV